MSLHVTTPTGFRRLTPPMLASIELADSFTGLPAGTAKPLRLLAAFQEAEPFLGLPPQAFKLIAWLVKMTMPCDWEKGSRPIAWPSAERIREFLNLQPTQVKTLQRALSERGIIVMRDSPTGKRYGRRAPDGRIIEAFGFDLSPLAVRYDEFILLAAEARAERQRCAALRKRATIARRSIYQVGEMMAAAGAAPVAWAIIADQAADLVAELRRVSCSDDLGLIVKGLERLHREASACAKELLSAVNSDPSGSENRPHYISTNPSLNLIPTVIASDEGSRAEPAALKLEMKTREPELYENAAISQPFEHGMKINPAELMELAPRLAACVASEFPTWTDIVQAAGSGLCYDLGVSDHLWGEACQVLSRQGAAITLAVVSTKPRSHFSRGAGGYFAAMVKRARAGELHIDRSLWKLRRDRWNRADA